MDTTRYDLLLACYRSGQINESEWQKYLQNEHFCAYVKRMEDARVNKVREGKS